MEDCFEKYRKQKRRFLCAIGKAEPSATEENDEIIVQKSQDTNLFDVSMSFINYRSCLWNDKIATEYVKTVLEKHQNFDIGIYLDCAKAIYLNYSGKAGTNIHLTYEAITYVVTHARSFSDPTQNMFQLEPKGSFQIKFGDLSSPLSDSIYMRKITALIKDLQIAYDEIKYMTLNTNVTYLTFLILRRFVKNDTQFLDAFKRVNTHDDYVKLCPYPLNSQLPRIADSFNKNIVQRSLQPSVVLAIHAFLTGADAGTKRVLRATCAQYIEWTGLQLPSLYFQVVKLYGIEAGELWDSLTPFDIRVYNSLFSLADAYYKQYKLTKAEPPETFTWFPYCRALNGDYHRDLSASRNTMLCLLLAYLIDLKKGFDNSFVRKAHWASKLHHSDSFLEAAKKLHDKFNNKPKPKPKPKSEL